jgi:hypothetical protein
MFSKMNAHAVCATCKTFHLLLNGGFCMDCTLFFCKKCIIDHNVCHVCKEPTEKCINCPICKKNTCDKDLVSYRSSIATSNCAATKCRFYNIYESGYKICSSCFNTAFKSHFFNINCCDQKDNTEKKCALEFCRKCLLRHGKNNGIHIIGRTNYCPASANSDTPCFKDYCCKCIAKEDIDNKRTACDFVYCYAHNFNMDKFYNCNSWLTCIDCHNLYVQFFKLMSQMPYFADDNILIILDYLPLNFMFQVDRKKKRAAEIAAEAAANLLITEPYIYTDEQKQGNTRGRIYRKEENKIRKELAIIKREFKRMSNFTKF